MTDDQIEHVAIRRRGCVWSLPKPNRHHNVIRHMLDSGCEPPIFDEQGFLDSNGNFMNRKQAADYALRIGQIEKLKYQDDALFSEDLW